MFTSTKGGQQTNQPCRTVQFVETKGSKTVKVYITQAIDLKHFSFNFIGQLSYTIGAQKCYLVIFNM